MSGLSIVCRSLQHGENYVNWSEEVKCFLMGQECWIIFSGAEGEPEDVASKKLLFWSGRAMHAIIVSVADEMRPHIWGHYRPKKGMAYFEGRTCDRK